MALTDVKAPPLSPTDNRQTKAPKQATVRRRAAHHEDKFLRFDDSIIRGMEQVIRKLDNGYGAEKLAKIWADLMQSTVQGVFDPILPVKDRDDYKGKAFIFAWDKLLNNKPDSERLIDRLNRVEIKLDESKKRIVTDDEQKKDGKIGQAHYKMLRGVLPAKTRSFLESKGRAAQGEVGFQVASNFATFFGERSDRSGGFIYAMAKSETDISNNLASRQLGLTWEDVETRVSKLPWWDALDPSIKEIALSKQAVSDLWVNRLSPDQKIAAAKCSTSFLNNVQIQQDQVLDGLPYASHLEELSAKAALKLGADVWSDLQLDSNDPHQNQERADQRKAALMDALWASDWFKALSKPQKRDAANIAIFYAIIPRQNLRTEAAQDFQQWAGQSKEVASQALVSSPWFQQIQTHDAQDIATRSQAYPDATPEQIAYLNKLVVHLPRIRTAWVGMILCMDIILMKNAWADKKLPLPFKIAATLRTLIQGHALGGNARFIPVGEMEGYRWRTLYKQLDDILDLVGLGVPAYRHYRKHSAERAALLRKEDDETT